MTLSLIVRNGAIATNPTGFRPPVTRGLVGWWFLDGTSLDKVRRNLAPAADGALSTVVGTPVPTTTGTEFVSKTSWIDTGIVDDSSEISLVGVWSGATALGQQTPFITAYGTGSAPGVTGPIGTLLQVRAHSVSGSEVGFSYSYSNAGAGMLLDARSPAIDASIPRLYFGKYTGAAAYFRNYTAGSAPVVVNGAARVPNGQRSFLLGSSVSGPSTQANKGLVAAIYKAVLTNEEENLIGSFIRSYLGRRGITV